MSDDLHKFGMTLKFVYSLVGLLVGLACMFLGSFLGYSGVQGHTAFTGKVLGLSANLNDAAPGVILFVVGLFAIFITKFSVRDKTVTTKRSDAEDEESLREVQYLMRDVRYFKD